MQNADPTRLAAAIVLGAGVLWGLYWLPVRALETLGLPGAWGTAAIAFSAALLLLPFVARARTAFLRLHAAGVAALALGGAAFALYSVSFLYGRIALVILLFYLTPVWCVLIGRVVLGWRAPPLRLAAIGVGFAGLVVMLGADNGVPLPRNAGEWLSLASGLLWAIASTTLRVKPMPAPVPAAFVFALGAGIGALILLPLLGPPAQTQPRGDTATILAISLGAGALWWTAVIAGLLWATARLDPARVGILLMSEVLVGTLSGVFLAGEYLSPVEMAGGALVLMAGVLELWPQTPRRAEA
jgi:drug/metabolite transporter (DMT)-like permease